MRNNFTKKKSLLRSKIALTTNPKRIPPRLGQKVERAFFFEK